MASGCAGRKPDVHESPPDANWQRPRADSGARPRPASRVPVAVMAGTPGLAAMSRLGGGIGTRGPGETQLETDRRKIQRKLLQLKRELEDVRRVRTQQRHRRAACR